MSAAARKDNSTPILLALAHLAEVICGAAVPISVLDRDSRFLFVNHSCGELLQQSREFLTGRLLRDTFQSPQMGEFEDRIRRVADMRVTETYEEELDLALGTLWRASVLTPVPLPDRESPVVLCISIDITRQKRAEAVLVERVEFEQLIAESCSSLVQAGEGEMEEVVDRTLRAIGEFMAVDRVLLFEFDVEVSHLNCCNEWHTEGIEPAIGRLQKQSGAKYSWLFPKILAGQPLLVSNVRELPDEARAEREELSRHGVQSLVWVPLQSRGRVVGALCLDSIRCQRDWSEQLLARLKLAGDIIANARERMFAERALAASRQELARVDRVNTLGEMAAGIAHEISQPLCALNNFVTAAKGQLLQPSPGDPQQIITWLDAAGTASRTAGEILQRLRSFARGHPIRQRQRESMVELVDEALQLLQFELSRRDMRVELQVDGPPAYLLADRVQIQQVLVNLIQNACDAVEAAPSSDRSIQLVVISRPAEIEVLVRDHGIGLPAEEIRIFEPFVTTKPAGLGLGLAISKTIIEDHGGRMWAERNPDSGATFHFVLPRAVEPATAAPCATT
jgi:PAS domain S-box-containing protein